VNVDYTTFSNDSADHHEIGLEMLLIDSFGKIKSNLHTLYLQTRQYIRVNILAAKDE
jgi:hypothetical protein